MALKRFQERVLREVETFLEALASQQAARNARHAASDAWEEAKQQFHIPGQYQPRRNGLGKDLPTFCIKVPTGGGKTLLAAEILGVIHRTILKDRNGTGLVLWAVPSDQIYKDTLRALRDRRHFYRESLEFALSRRIEVWEKHEIARLTSAQLQSNLNILILKLASTNRESQDQLKFFRDSGGNIVQHFPPEDEPEKHKALQARIPNLDMLAEDETRGEYLAKTSLANLVRICEPAVVLDEGHKATSSLARKTIEGFNASIVVELSATPPKDSNILVRVSGQELLDEQMIKLPINIANSNQRNWRECLTQARDKRDALSQLAARHFKTSGKHIRPIVLVHGVHEPAVAIKTSEKDDIEGIDLLAEGCPVEWIITKSALQEGWDCPFAYVLVSLNNTGSQQSMTQLVGRVLRQPLAEQTPFQELNESYVYCLRRRAADISREVKKALEKEGYEGDAGSVVDRSDVGGKPPEKNEPSIRRQFLAYYRKPFEGRIYLPRLCVKDGRRYEALDYFRHLISQVDVERFAYTAVDWDMSVALASAADSFYRLTLGQEAIEQVDEREATILESDEQVKAWLVASLPFDHLSHKQLRTIVNRAAACLQAATANLSGRLGLVKFQARDRIVGSSSARRIGRHKRHSRSSMRMAACVFISTASRGDSRFRDRSPSAPRGSWCMTTTTPYSVRSSTGSRTISTNTKGRSRCTSTSIHRCCGGIGISLDHRTSPSKGTGGTGSTLTSLSSKAGARSPSPRWSLSRARASTSRETRTPTTSARLPRTSEGLAERFRGRSSASISRMRPFAFRCSMRESMRIATGRMI